MSPRVMTPVVALAILTAVVPVPAQSVVGTDSTARNPTVFPEGRVFERLTADPKDTRFQGSVLGVSAPDRSTTVGAVALGEQVGIVRWTNGAGKRTVQLGLSAGVFAQFDLQTPSMNLMNADYVLGIPLTLRQGPVSARLRVYHQSSHLGDEYLLTESPDRVNLSFESVEALVALQGANGALADVRVYGGGEYLLRREPSELKPGILHAGIEARQGSSLFDAADLGEARLVLGLDARMWEHHEWRPAWSLRAGLEFGPVGGRSDSDRGFSVLLELYDGPSSYGQFVTQQIQYAGVGLHFRL